jgi:hypothetical protein
MRTPEAALPLKERLTAWRAQHLEKALPNCAKPAAGRLGDILKPLLQIIRLVKPEREPVKELERGRLLDKADTLEGKILQVVWSLRAWPNCRSTICVPPTTLPSGKWPMS